MRTGSLRAKARTQCSVAISADGSRWILLNASPDIRQQMFSFPELLPKSGVRGSAVEAVMLTDAELDHVTGLLSLRESQPIRIYCTSSVLNWVFGSNPVFGALNSPERFQVVQVEAHKPETIGCGLRVEAYFVEGKIPTYVKNPPAVRDGAAVAYKVIDARTGSSILHVPAIRKIDDRLAGVAAECDCLMFDGSFWSENEMESHCAGTRTASAMGHIPISGPAGSLARLRDLSIRKIYSHINNTNPILNETSAERHEVEAAGWQIAEDGMDFVV